MMSVLVTGGGVDAEFDKCEVGMVLKMDWAGLHDGFGKILEELEEEPDAYDEDFVCGFETKAGNCAASDVDEEGKIDLSEVGALPACKVKYAGDSKS